VTIGTATKASSCAMALIVAEPIHEFSIFAPIQTHQGVFCRSPQKGTLSEIR
jgi:hypothetical protein